MDDAPALPLGDGDEASDDETPCAAPGEPRTAEEFMRMMRRESRRMGDVFLAENEAERSANASVPGPAPAPSPRAPPAAWERSLLADLADAAVRKHGKKGANNLAAYLCLEALKKQHPELAADETAKIVAELRKTEAELRAKADKTRATIDALDGDAEPAAKRAKTP